MNYLLDTNICVYFMRGKRNVAAKISEIGQEHFFISEMTLGELLYGAQCSDRPSENIRAVHVFCQYVTILPTANIWNEFAVQKAFLRKKGQLIEDADIIIGTTAIINNMDSYSGIIIEESRRSEQFSDFTPIPCKEC
jgi:tRNA(fMet)-specific endonuclease VapC